MPAILAGLSLSLNESPSEKEGKYESRRQYREFPRLNESPSEKEGKYQPAGRL